MKKFHINIKCPALYNSSFIFSIISMFIFLFHFQHYINVYFPVQMFPY